MKGYKLAAAVGAVTAVLGLGVGTAVADDYPGGTNTPPTVLGEQITREAPAAVLGQSSTQGAVSGSSAATGALPLTGGDIAGMTATGVAAIGLGSVLVRRRRRSSSVTA